jgi:hypothetical protein
MFLSLAIHYPCLSPLNVTEETVCVDWFRKVKKFIIEKSNGLFTEENTTVLFIPVTAVTDDPVLVVAYRDMVNEEGVVNIKEFAFKRLVEDALRTDGDNFDKKFLIHTVPRDRSLCLDI